MMPFSSISCLNLMFLSALLRLSRRIFPSSSVAMNKMSSTYFIIMIGLSIIRKA